MAFIKTGETQFSLKERRISRPKKIRVWKEVQPSGNMRPKTGHPSRQRRPLDKELRELTGGKKKGGKRRKKSCNLTWRAPSASNNWRRKLGLGEATPVN